MTLTLFLPKQLTLFLPKAIIILKIRSNQTQCVKRLKRGPKIHKEE